MGANDERWGQPDRPRSALGSTGPRLPARVLSNALAVSRFSSVPERATWHGSTRGHRSGNWLVAGVYIAANPFIATVAILLWNAAPGCSSQVLSTADERIATRSSSRAGRCRRTPASDHDHGDIPVADRAPGAGHRCSSTPIT